MIYLVKQSDEYLKKQYKHVLNQFDLINILNQYYINQVRLFNNEFFFFLSTLYYRMNKTNKIMKFNYRNVCLVFISSNIFFVVDLVRRKNNQLKTSHENELIVLNKQNDDTINSMKKTHKQEMDKLLVIIFSSLSLSHIYLLFEIRMKNSNLKLVVYPYKKKWIDLCMKWKIVNMLIHYYVE